MSNAPKRPTIDDPSKAVIEWIDAANAYADHLEQRVRELEAQRDEAVEIIREFDAYTRGEIFHVDIVRMNGFLARIDKEATNDHE